MESEILNRKGPERIICAAIHFDDGVPEHPHQPKGIETGYVVAGRRHHNCFSIHAILTAKKKFNGKITQGFITSHDRFVDRSEAGTIAYTALQTEEITNCLFSEDLY